VSAIGTKRKCTATVNKSACGRKAAIGERQTGELRSGNFEFRSFCIRYVATGL
jgi:hypothetical protein